MRGEMEGLGRAGPLPANQLDRLTELMPVPIVRLDRGGRCAYATARWCQLTGMERDAALGDGWLEAVDPTDREPVRAHLSGPHAASELADEFRIRDASGQTRVLSSRVVPLPGDFFSVDGCLVAVTDVTERYETEAVLRRAVRELGGRVRELYCLFEMSHIVERAAGSLERIVRETVELLPASWEHSDIACARITLDGWSYSTANFRQTRWRQSAEVRVQGAPVGLVEVCYLEKRASTDEGPFRKEERDLIEAVAERLGQIAERVRAERLLSGREQELRERLTHLTRVSLLGELASSIAHEVNQPLTAVSTYAQACRRLLESGGPDRELLLETLDRIADEALRAGDIVHRLKELVRRRDSRREDIDVNELIRDVERLAAVDARLHDVRLRLALSESLPSVRADGIQLQQVILNLIRNGVDAMADTEPETRELLVRTASNARGEVEVSIIDAGCGVPAAAEPGLFEPFFTTKETGMGMGLSISRTIVEAHGGRMWFMRNPGRGSTFGFTLPAAGSGREGDG